jgi:hypothetical protein
MLLTSAAVLRFPMLWSGMSVETETRRKNVGYLQTVVSDCGVTSFFAKLTFLSCMLDGCSRDGDCLRFCSSCL